MDNNKMTDEILLAILAKDKSRELPLFFKCIEEQDYDKKKIHLYIRSNDNKDNTIDIIEEWLSVNQDKYASCYKDYSNISDELKKYKQHEWNSVRFSILGNIRQKSIEYAKNKGLNYFVVDCDNFIKPWVISKMVSSNLPVVAPFLKIPPHFRRHGREHGPLYSNFHFEVDANGYYRDSYNRYADVYNKVFKGYINCCVVHCTYYIRYEYLKFIQYMDNTAHHEYIIFSRNLRRAGVPQYLYNEECGGVLVLLQEGEELNISYENVMIEE